MSTATIYQDMNQYADADNWQAHAEAEKELLATRASTLHEIAPKLQYLASMMGSRSENDIEAQIVHPLLRDVDEV